ncbi:serine/threonine-protein kinase [Sorangium atrum]|uniref:Serine/threonine-protein kinase n=1 Tax=Sorangium atrum TaxID=2995308 RepID=A0ABT5CDT4_9BACT|nr:serine/threonine-protein kinase [Sorangium aterium]MDC0684601.1 serine/threonine-protein kinase [Sorangium aterium]
MALPSHEDCRCAAPELSDTLLDGTPYRPVRRLGRGGMGEVIEAAHVGLDKPVVVKLLHRDLNREPRLVERMRVEAQSLARLAHPNLVTVTDFGRTAEGRTFLVMERLYGRTMREELAARGALPATEALDLVTQTLAGLAAAHGAGIVHRDVKLENLFVCDADAQGRRVVKVLDFGIAKVVAPRGDGRAPAPSLYQTEEGVLVGTPRYLSPEQACGLAVDARTDVYAAGVVLYTLVAGRDPFEHMRRVHELVRAHASEVPAPPSSHAPRLVPPELDRAIMRALEKRPELRFPDAAAFAAELSRIAAGLSRGVDGGSVVPSGSYWQRTAPLTLPPVRAPVLPPTLSATVKAFGLTALDMAAQPTPGAAQQRASEAHRSRARRARRPARPEASWAAMGLLVVSVVLFGFTLALLVSFVG